MSVFIITYKIIPDVKYIPNLYDKMRQKDWKNGYKEDTYEGKYSCSLVTKKEVDAGAPIPNEKVRAYYQDHSLTDYYEDYIAWREIDEKWVTKLMEESWSDKNIHQKFDIRSRRKYMSKKTFNYLINLPNVSNFSNGMGRMVSVLPIEEQYLFQGWFFKPRFFNRDNTYFVTTSKKKMIEFLYKYIDFNYNYTHRGEGRCYINIQESVEKLIENFENGMIFECCF